MKATKEMVTTILMNGTTKVLEKVCLEEIEARKVVLKQAAVQPVRVSAALASLAQFGSSDSDESDDERLPPPPPGTLKSLSTAQKFPETPTPLPGIGSMESSSSEDEPEPVPKEKEKKAEGAKSPTDVKKVYDF